MDFKHLADNSGDAIIALDRELCFVYANPAAERAIGRPLSELQGRSVADLFPEIHQTTFLAHHRHALEQQTTVEFDDYYPSNGRWYTVRSQGHPGGLYVTFRDVTEQRHVEEVRAAAHAEQARISQTLQQSLLLRPHDEDAFPGLLVGMLYQAASDEALVGGDFSDAFALSEDLIALVVGDVTGKGLSSATYTAEIKFALRAFLRENPDPAVSLSRLNHYLIAGRRHDLQPHEEYVAVALAVVDTRTGEATCSAAGAEPPLLVRRRGSGARASASAVEVGGPLLAVEESAEFETATAMLERGDLLALTTDGVTEARPIRPGGTWPRRPALFGYDGFARAAEQAARLPSLKTACRSIVTSALAFAGEMQTDDICLLLARRL